MNENFVRHLSSFIAMVVVAIAWWAGYVSGGHGWWWTVFGCVVIYIATYIMLEV